MTEPELQQRLVAWTWAAQTLGVEISITRLRGLVEVTGSVRIASLKPALEACIKSEPNGFLPSPGAVIAMARTLAERSAQHRINAPREMGSDERKRWAQDANPEGWDTETWKAFSERMATDAGYERRVKQALAQRHAWAADEMVREIGQRDASHEFRLNLRRQLNREAFDVYPRPHPTADGWVPSAQFDPIKHLARTTNP